MLGLQNRDQTSLFCEFRLDDMIPKSHLLRRVNVFVTSVLAICASSWTGFVTLTNDRRSGTGGSARVNPQWRWPHAKSAWPTLGRLGACWRR
jgi:hypothetical protein